MDCPLFEFNFSNITIEDKLNLFTAVSGAPADLIVAIRTSAKFTNTNPMQLPARYMEVYIKQLLEALAQHERDEAFEDFVD